MSTGAADILARIRAAGLTVSPDVADPGKVYVAPRERLTAIVSARRQADGGITVSEIAGDWADPTLPDLETWTPSGEAS